LCVSICVYKYVCISVCKHRYKCKRKKTPTYVYGHWMGGRISTIMDEGSKGIMGEWMNG